MKKNSSILLFAVILIIGTIITLRRNSWLIIWVGLELNIMSFLPILALNKNIRETPITYFLVQSIGSIILLFSVLTPLINYRITTLAILVKIGAAPIHLWIIQIIEKINWFNCLILTTWQKIAPIIILVHIKNIIILAIVRIILGAIGGLNQTSLRKLIAFSSVNHIGWIIATLENNTRCAIKYLLIYSTMITLLLTTLEKKKIFFINQIPENINKIEKINLIIMILRLGGLPPFIGFIAKWIIIQDIININIIFIVTTIIIFSIITLFFYLRIITPLIILEASITKITVNSKITLTQAIIFFTNVFILPIIAFTLI